MEVIAKGKYIGVSPKKARAIANLVRGKNGHDAVVMLSHMPQAGASAVKKVLTSAMANAENNFNLDKKELNITKITVDGGPVIKRYQPRAKGSASPILRRTSHIEVVVAGEIKTKKPKDAKIGTENKVVETGHEEEQSHKVEVERPSDKSIYTTTPKEMGKKMFRRKTG